LVRDHIETNPVVVQATFQKMIIVSFEDHVTALTRSRVINDHGRMQVRIGCNSVSRRPAWSAWGSVLVARHQATGVTKVQPIASIP
jgi:hypothetical protein